MPTIRLHAAILAMLVVGTIARAAEGDSARYADLASIALSVISSHNPVPDEGFLLMCPVGRADSLAKDGDIGAYIRHMRAVGSDLAVVVVPVSMRSGTTYVIYFKNNTALGSLALPSSPAPTDEVVANAYARLTGAIPQLKRHPSYDFGEIQADDGTEIQSLKIIGWH